MLDRLAGGINQHWFAVGVIGNEVAMRDRIQLYGFAVFLPLIQVEVRALPTRRWQRRQDLRPALEGYVFVSMPMAGADWRGLREVPGVSSVVSTAGQPAVIDVGLLVEFQRRAQAGEFDRTTVRTRVFRAGDSVRIMSGDKEGKHGTIKQVRGKTARMLLYLFGKPELYDTGLDNLLKIA
jgi:transcription antitermination factor NusG